MATHLPGDGSGDDLDEDGYDESQRAEILEATRDGPSDGLILTDLDPDLGDAGDDDEPEDDLSMTDDEVGEEDDEATPDEGDLDEDDVEDDFDDENVDEDDDDLDDPADAALRP